MEIDLYYESGPEFMNCRILYDDSGYTLFPFKDLLEDFTWVLGDLSEGNAFPDINTLTVSRLLVLALLAPPVVALYTDMTCP